MAWGARGASAVNDLVQRVLANDPRLTELHVMLTRKLDDGAVKALCMAFMANTNCKTLYTSGHVMSPASAAIVADMLRQNRSLRTLCVGNEAFGDDALISLGPGLGEACCLEFLDLENKGLSASGFKHLIGFLERNLNLSKLVLTKNVLGTGGWAALLGTTLNVRHVELQHCRLSGEGLEALVSDPPSLPRLCNLHLGHNDFSTVSARHLVALLSSCTALRSLSFERCALGDAGVSALVSALQHTPALSHLDLSHCGITEAGAHSLAAALAERTAAAGATPALQGLILSGNPLAEAGVTALASGLANAHSLRSLELGECGMSAAALDSLARLTQLAALSVFGNRMGDPAAQAITAAMSRTEAGDGHPARGFCSLTTLGVSGNELSCAALTKFLEALQALPTGARF